MPVIIYLLYLVIIYVIMGGLAFAITFWGAKTFGLPKTENVNRIAKWIGIILFSIGYILFKVNLIPFAAGPLAAIVISLGVRFILNKMIKENSNPEEPIQKKLSDEELQESINQSKKESNHAEYMPK